MTDDIADALDYSAIAGIVRTMLKDGNLPLTETPAERIQPREDAGLHRVRVLPGLCERGA
jgi:dihydroneopterin aldolase